MLADERKSDFTYIMFSQHLHHYVLKAEYLMKEKVIYPLNKYCSEKYIPESRRRLFLKLEKHWPELLKYCYIRKIGNENKLKVLMGAPEKSPLINHLSFQQG